MHIFLKVIMNRIPPDIRQGLNENLFWFRMLFWSVLSFYKSVCKYRQAYLYLWPWFSLFFEKTVYKGKIFKFWSTLVPPVKVK